MIVALVSSALLGIAVAASRVVLGHLAVEGASRDPHAYWALGLVTPLPAWLVAFLGLLSSQPGAKLQLVSGVAWMLSAAAGLVGAIVTEAIARGAGDSVGARQATRLWRVGLLALLPAWGIALLGHAAPH